MASGLWDEVHDLLGFPFYRDFETGSKTFVSMSLSYFNDNYSVVSNKHNIKPVKQINEPAVPEPVVTLTAPICNTAVNANGTSIDESVLDELFGTPEQAKPVVNPTSGDLTALLFAEAGNGL
jgi:hypothetical protein